jgi:4-amino-4-deoxy-L-arabinose transferase-like glycosyltransferase
MTATLAPARPAPAAEPEHPRRGRAEWIALTALLAATAVLYLWNLGAEGWANTYYAGAVRAMTQNWTAFFFGSTDAGNTVTVDKPPASLWAMALSARIFGLSSWSMLVPQALMGIGAVALLYAAVRRAAGPAAALLAGGAFALTPIAVLMFRYNNPDALLVLQLVAAAYATVRAIEIEGDGETAEPAEPAGRVRTASTRWIVLAGALIGFAFLAKMMQAFVVIPALALAYLVAAPTGFWRRVRQLLAAGLTVVVAAGWWVAIAELWPATSRPYIGGSEGNSVLDLTFGYNGLGRIFGQGRGRTFEAPAGAEPPPPGFEGGGGFGGFGGAAGWSRLFGEQVGGQVSWLLPAALVLLVSGLVLTRRTARTDRLRASILLWGGWTAVTAAVFSFAQGIFHPYYTVALAPGIAALVGIGGVQLWRRRATWPARITLSVIIAGTAAWAVVLLSRTPDFVPWLRWVVIALAAVAVLALLVGAHRRRLTVVAALAMLLTGGAAQVAYAADTITSTPNGGNPMAGPATDSGPGGGMRGARSDGGQYGTAIVIGPGGPGGGIGARGNSSDPELVALLRGAGTTWAAATTSASNSAGLALASGTDVMGIGGFSGGDPAPTLERFQDLVAAGEVRYFIGGGGGPGRESAIATWVQEHFASTTVGGCTVYDLSRPAG